MMAFMRCAWARMSRMGPCPGRIHRWIIREGVQVSGDHRQRRAQLVRGIGDEVLAHRLEAHLPRHIAHQQQRLAAAVGHHLQRQEHIELHRRTDDQRHRKIIAVQVVRELRGANQIVDAQAHVHRPPQPQQSGRLTVEPDDFALRRSR